MNAVKVERLQNHKAVQVMLVGRTEKSESVL